MMAQKHLLHELLKEDQEPFLLKNYIADRRSQLNRPSQRTLLQVKKHKPISHHSSNFPHSFCKNACFFSFRYNSTNPTKSPLFDFQSPAKSPSKTNPNTVFLHIPARTAALLLDAALRIQKQSSSNPKSKAQSKNNGFGMFGSLIKRLTHLNKPQKREISYGDKNFFNGRDRKQSGRGILGAVNEKNTSFSCSCNGRTTSKIWSESNEEKSLDLESSSSDQVEELLVAREFDSFDQHFCESPFQFVLRRSTSSSGHRTPEFLSPAASPSRHKAQGKDSNDIDQSFKNFQAQEELEEEDKEQCSPVSVLDPPFVDDDDDEGHHDPSKDHGFDLQCNHAFVQIAKAKQQLLAKLRRFEKLAELDPVELEKRIIDQEDEMYENDDINNQDEEGEREEQFISSYAENNIKRFLVAELTKSSFCGATKIPRDIERLVSDLISEEEREQEQYVEEECVAKRVCKRLESWKEVKTNTIDMMVEEDFKRELIGWKLNQEQVGETAVEIEVAIFGLLVEELTQELTGLTDMGI